MIPSSNSLCIRWLILSLSPMICGFISQLILGVITLLLSLMRWLSGRLSQVDVKEELTTRDNFAFGISLAGRMLSLCIVFSAVVGRHVGDGYLDAAISMLLLGTLGIVLIKVGRYCHDKIVLHKLQKEVLINDRNVAVAMVDAASAVAMALMIRSILLWVEGSDKHAIAALLASFFVVLLILLITTRFYERHFARNNQGAMQDAFKSGQTAIALEHSGHLLGTAVVVSLATQLLDFYANGLCGKHYRFCFCWRSCNGEPGNNGRAG